MKIWVSSLSKVHDTVAIARARRVVSLLSPSDVFPQIAGLSRDDHHRVHLHDIIDDIEGHVPPSETHVKSLIGFLERWRPDDTLVVHCWAGISRSTATAFVAACMHNAHADEDLIAAELRAASRTAHPNLRIVKLADKLLGRSGRMVEAVEAIGPGDFSLEAAPFCIRSKY